MNTQMTSSGDDMGRVRPSWWKDLLIHMVAIMVAMLVVASPCMALTPFAWLAFALASPILYLVYGPYVVVLVAAQSLQRSSESLFWVLVVFSYVAYYALLSCSLLAKKRAVRIAFYVMLVAWFCLTVFSFLCLVSASC